MKPTQETLATSGDLVAQYTWDHGSPGVGGHTDSVFHYRGHFYASFDYDGLVLGPFESLDEALAQGFLGVNSATAAIWCTELSRAELIQRLVIYDDAQGRVVDINDKPWRVPKKRLTIAVVRARIEGLRRKCAARASASGTSGLADYMVRGVAGQNARLLEDVLTRLAGNPTWSKVVGELTSLRLHGSFQDREREQLLRFVETEATRRRARGSAESEHLP